MVDAATRNQEKKTNTNDYQNIKGQGAANTLYLRATYAQAMRELCAELYHAVGACSSDGLGGSKAPKSIHLMILFGTPLLGAFGKK